MDTNYSGITIIENAIIECHILLILMTLWKLFMGKYVDLNHICFLIAHLIFEIMKHSKSFIANSQKG